MLAPKRNEYNTYNDYVTWDEANRYEIIDGIAYLLAAPLRNHQKVSVELVKQLAVFLTGKQCEVYSAPFDVKISDDTVVQPDISVICDQDKLTDAGCTGAPDMIIEILSPSNSSYDTIVKLNKYISCGVREYWLVDIQHQAILVYLFKDGTVDSLNTYTFHEDIPVHSLPGCLLNLKDVADDENLEDG